ncbi:hypothetical protein HGRIS_013090 [Hohenbuehelia grisea]|uniref:Uncharacterized protein n=1 Tax=Hohenbuehelia grisea TaxID=104357 RepID=A0ABR3IUD8_9AGAR
MVIRVSVEHSTTSFSRAALALFQSIPLPLGPGMQASKPRADVVFSSDVRNMDDWARRTNIPLTTADALGATYVRARPWFDALRMQLIQNYQWKDATARDDRLLMSLETSSIWRSSVGLAAGPPLRLQLPLHASSFFNPDRRIQWQMVFHSDTFESVRKICPPITDILYLIQCLLTGLATVVFEEHLPEGIHRTTRALPPESWIAANEASLLNVFGHTQYKSLRKAARDVKAAYKLEVISYSTRR